MDMPVAVRSMACIELTILLQSDELLDEVDGHLGLLGEYTLDAVADVGTRGVECLVQHRATGSKVMVGCLLDTTIGGCGNEEVTHVVRALGVRIDVLETVSWGCHVLLGVVVADQVHD